VASYTSCVQCDCGARYERAEVQLPIKDVGVFECQYCGAIIERWHGKSVPAFRAIAPPVRKSSSAA